MNIKVCLNVHQCTSYFRPNFIIVPRPYNSIKALNFKNLIQACSAAPQTDL